MTPKELVVLLIHQKNYHDVGEKEKSPIKVKMRQEFAKIVGAIYASHVVGEIKTPALSLFKNQAALPVVLFNPCSVLSPTSNTAFIHTHGGPHVHMKKDTPHAEISYYLDNGFRVWCPNFRGSTGYGDAHEESGVGKLPAVAVQDVYLAAHALRASSPLLTPASNIILRGGSYGSCVNAHVLAMVKRGLKPNLFSGAHLVGGIKYPSAHEMPWDIPILIAHGVKDDVSPFELGARFALQLLYLGHKNIEFIAGLRGDHHMISTMRMFDQHLCTFDDIHEFLGAMSGEFAKRKDQSDRVFNDVRGYPSRAIAGIPFLTASRHNTASCSTTWHFESRSVSRPAPHKKVIAKLMKILGIYSPARVERYDEMFVIDQAEVATSDEQQSLMQQIFVPYDYADSHAYMSQIWGVRMGESQDDLSKPSIIKGLIADPVSFENKLVQNKGAFTNPEDVNYDPCDYMYTDLLQLRAILRPGSTSRVNSFFRNPEQTNLLMERLQREILWDFADFIISRTQIPQSLIHNSNDFPNALRERAELTGDKSQHSTYVAYHVQKALTAQEHTRHGVFGGIAKCPDDVRLIMQGLDREAVLEIQNKLIKKNLGKPPKKMCTYSVCYYLQGYTYHSLLLEAIQKTITDSPHENYAADMKTKSQKILMGAIEMFANPSSVNEFDISSGFYEQVRRLSLSFLNHKRDKALHKFFQRSSEGNVYEDHLWGLELNNAIYSYLNYAREASKNNNSFKYRNSKQRDEHCFYKQVVKPIEDMTELTILRK